MNIISEIRVKNYASPINTKDMASYLTYTKSILGKFSFDNRLLNKEYKKAIKLLTEQERRKLNIWIRKQKFSKAILFKKKK